jgi:hypothetical protein
LNKQLSIFLLKKWNSLIHDSAIQLVYHKQCELAQKRHVQPPEKPISLDFDAIKCISIIRNKIIENNPNFKDKLIPFNDDFELDFESLYELYCEYNLLQINKIKKCINNM